MVRMAAGWLAAIALLGAVPRAQGGELFERVVSTLEKRFHDEEFRRERLPELAMRYRAAARAAATRDEERAVVDGLLAEIPASHLALYSAQSHRRLIGDLGGRKQAPTVGCELTQRAGRFFVHSVLDGGPAACAGVLRGDRVLSIDGVPTGASPRLDWRTDDAHLPDAPIHALLCEAGETVVLALERRPDERLDARVAVAEWSAFLATKASARVLEADGKRYGYVHLWMIFVVGPDRLLRDLLAGDFAACDGLILDLRGRGGSAAMVPAIINQFAGARSEWGRPVAVLIDRDTRSAKEVLAFEIRRRNAGILVGERTAGAVIPATFEKVAPDAVLMFPSFTLGSYTERIEGVGVPPDVEVIADYEHAAGRDPILDAALAELAAGRVSRPGQR